MMELAHDKTGLEKDSGQIESNVWYNSRGGEWDGCRHQDGHDHQVTKSFQERLQATNDEGLSSGNQRDLQTSVIYVYHIRI